MMKILIVVAADLLETNGTTVRAQRVSNMINNQFDVSLLGYSKYRPSLPKAKLLALLPYWLVRLIYTLLSKKFDYIYLCHDRYGFIIAKILQAVCRYKIIYEAHAAVSEEFEWMGKSSLGIKFMRYLESFIARHSNYVVALSQNTFEFFSKRTANIELIPVFLDTNHYRFNEIERIKIRSRYGVDDVLAGLIGPFDTPFNKHYLTFLENNLDKFDRRIKFMVIGRCTRNIRRSNVIYAGYVKNYIDYLSSLDCVIIPSKVPTGGPLNKIVEAMSLKLPVFTTPQGMVGLYYIQPGRDIFVFEDRELAIKLNEIVFNRELMKTVGDNGYIMVENYYSEAANRRKLVALLSEAVQVERRGT